MIGAPLRIVFQPNIFVWTIEIGIAIETKLNSPQPKAGSAAPRRIQGSDALSIGGLLSPGNLAVMGCFGVLEGRHMLNVVPPGLGVLNTHAHTGG